jgi:hypothetical protein
MPARMISAGPITADAKKIGLGLGCAVPVLINVF